jgi:hypothetical protein
MSKMGKIDGKITHFGQFWTILPISIGKKITDSDWFKKTHRENGKNSLKLLSAMWASLETKLQTKWRRMHA